MKFMNIAKNVMLANGCDTANAEALADIICRAERDGIAFAWVIPSSRLRKSA